MIDTKELRRLTQEATHPMTKGRWVRLFGERVVYDRMEDGCRGIPVVSTPVCPPNPFESACLDFIAAANPAAITELLDRLESAEKERDALRADKATLQQMTYSLKDHLEAAEADGMEQARLNGMGGEREAALLSKLEAAEKERDALRAKIERMGRQEPIGEMLEISPHNYELRWYRPVPFGAKLYALPGAQPAPSVPEGFALVNAAHFLAVLDREDWRTAKNRAELRAMLAAAPKPEGE